MSKRGGAKRASNTTLREDKKQRKGGSINPKSALKLEHLQRLASWTSGEASIPSLGAFFGNMLASTQECLDVPPDPSLFSCQRCETILQPGFNCTIRIEKNTANARRRSKKPTNFTFTRNNVMYTCHFCSHRDVKRGTSRGHMKGICPPKTKTSSNLKAAKSISQKFVTPKKSTAGEDKVSKSNEITSSAIAEEIPSGDSPATPMVQPIITLLDSKRKMRNKSASKKRSEPENSPAPVDAENSVSTTNKRRPKSWTSLKELAGKSEQKKYISDLSIPFFM
ncbi:hypothetical protein M0R45_009211 [Rubus argutus]|uniref:Uncharacterized protein n=1 Tax=Rubus argutus TaxID=59490 RepID=A0AAW1Y4A8_RUBAR